MEKPEVSLGERVHIASKGLKNILTPSLWAAIAGLGLIGLAFTWTYSTSNVLEEYGFHENHWNFPEGPLCNVLDPLVDSDSDPAMIVVFDGGGAERAGIQNGDTIVEINGMEIPDAASLENWDKRLPDVKAGDVIEVIAEHDGQRQSFMVETAADQSQEGRPIIGVIIPYSCESYFFFDEEQKSLTLDSIRQIDTNLTSTYTLFAIFGVIFGWFLIWTLWKGKKLRNEMDEWEEAYLDQHYVLTFETNKPKGKTNGEKIFNMAQAVFPELRKKDGSFEKWKGKVVTDNGYEFDCIQTTNEDEKKVFLAKHFGKNKIDLETLQELHDNIRKGPEAHTLKEKIQKFNLIIAPTFRLICVGEVYDDKFMNDESLQKVMDELDFNDPIDLILEKDGNYSVLWVDT